MAVEQPIPTRDPVRLTNGEFRREYQRVRAASGKLSIVTNAADAAHAEGKGFSLLARDGAPLQMRDGTALYVKLPPAAPEAEAPPEDKPPEDKPEKPKAEKKPKSAAKTP